MEGAVSLKSKLVDESQDGRSANSCCLGKLYYGNQPCHRITIDQRVRYRKLGGCEIISQDANPLGNRAAFWIRSTAHVSIVR